MNDKSKMLFSSGFTTELLRKAYNDCDKMMTVGVRKFHIVCDVCIVC